MPTKTGRLEEIAAAIARGETVRIPSDYVFILLEAAATLRGTVVWDIQIENGVASIRKPAEEPLPCMAGGSPS